jgi:hypothetical protein
VSEDNDDDKVGYGRPPRKSQFQKGRSGNPSGKRKRLQDNSVTFDDEVAAELSKLVGPKGKRKRGSARNALAKRVVHKGVVEGDARFVKLARDADLRAAERRRDAPEQSLSPDEERIVAELVARIRGEV